MVIFDKMKKLWYSLFSKKEMSEFEEIIQCFKDMRSGKRIIHLEYDADYDQYGRVYHFSLKHCYCSIDKNHGTRNKWTLN